MPTIPLRQIGLKGLIKDAQGQDIPASGITSGENIRIKDRALQSWAPVIEVISFAETEQPLYADGIYRDSSIPSGQIVVLLDSTLMAFSEGFSQAFNVEGQTKIYFYDTNLVRTDITPISPMIATENWHGVRIGELYTINNDAIDLPHSWFINNQPDEPFQILSGWPTNFRCRFMGEINSSLVAGGLTENGVEVRYRIKWSHPISPGDTTTFWDISDPTILAGEVPLLTNSRHMTALVKLKDLLIIYFDKAVYRMTFVGGQFVMSFELAFNDDGAVSSRSIVEVDGLAFVFGFNDVYSHDGYTKTSLTDLRMTRYIENRIDPERAVDAVYFALYNEIQFLTRSPTTTVDVDGDLIFTYNIVHDAWVEADVSGDDSLPAIGLIYTGPSVVADGSWNAITQTWDTIGSLTWAGAFQSPLRENMYAISFKNQVVYDWSPDGFGLGDSITLFSKKARIQHTHIDMDEGGEAVGNKIVYVNRVYPQMTGKGTVRFRFGVHATAQAPVQWINYVEFKINVDNEADPNEPAADYACDIRMAGRYLAYEITVLDEAEFAFSGMDIEVAMGGEV